MANVSITEEFDDTRGRFLDYETADLTVYQKLLDRAHRDIRTFSNEVDVVPRVLYHFTQVMQDLDLLTMEDLQSFNLTTPEGWTVGTYGPDATLENRSTLTLDLPIGTTTTSSVREPVDFSDFLATDEISLALPGFPASSLDLANSYLHFTQGTQTVSLPFSTDLVDGDTEAKWPLSALGDMTQPTEVEFEFVATAATTVKISALRVLTPAWTPTKLDINTLNQRLQPTVTRTGIIPSDSFPKLWRTSSVPGENDPLPINTKLALNFYTGSSLQSNSVTLFFRARREDYLTQLDLDSNVTQEQLDTYGVQPDYGQAMYNPRPQSDYDVMDQAQMETFTQRQLERQPDYISEAWLSVTLRFGTTNEVRIATTETALTDEIAIPAVFEPNNHYLTIVEIEDDAIRVTIYTLDGYGRVSALIFDSFKIKNNSLILRRKGRIGWTMDIRDGDAYVNSVRSRGMIFNEFISQNYESLTPVEGARLFVGATPDVKTPVATLPFGESTVTVDTVNTRSTDGSIRVATPYALTGVQSQPIIFEDFSDTEIAFDIYYSKPDAPPELYLFNERGLFVTIGMPGIIPDTWNSVRLPLSVAYLEQTGIYRVVIVSLLGSPTFWIDNLVVSQRAVKWSGRSKLEDPWGQKQDEWTEFKSLINSETDGVVFPERGHFLQVRGQALLQDSMIEKIYTKPKYAQLGRIVGSDPITSIPDPPTPHTVRMDVTPHGQTVGFGGYVWDDIYTHEVGETLTFTATVKGGNNPDIVEYYWDFGDGVEASTTEPTVTHSYNSPNVGLNAHVRARAADGTVAWANLNLMLFGQRTDAPDPPPGPGSDPGHHTFTYGELLDEDHQEVWDNFHVYTNLL